MKGEDCQTKREWEPCWILGKRYGLSRIWDSFCSPQGNKQGPIKRSPNGITTGRNAAARLGVISWKIGGIALPDALTDNHHSTLHAFFLAAKEGGYTEFELQLVASPKGRVEFCISPREHSEISAKFEVRGNMIRAAANEASVVPTDDTDFGIYGGTRSGEAPLRIAPSP